MTDEELREYARFLIEDHATDVEGLTIYEMWEHGIYPDATNEEMTRAAVKRVSELIERATVTVTWDEEKKNA